MSQFSKRRSSIAAALATPELRRRRYLKHRGTVDLHGANLATANFAGCDFHKANLQGANLSAANLTGTDLTTASLEGANLSEAILTGANLTAAKLAGADLSTAVGVTREQIKAAVIDERTRLPQALLER